MSRFLEIVVHITGDQTERETFISNMAVAADNIGWTVDGSTYVKNVPYSTDVITLENALYDLITANKTANIIVVATETSHSVTWS